MAVDSLPELGLGTYDVDDHETCVESVETALNCGYRHLDTAEGYENERAVGEGLEAADVDREDVFLATKVSSENLARGDVLEHARASADRLGVETLDLLYVHWPIRAYDPEATLSALDELYDEGLIRHVGLSNFLPGQLDKALDRLEAPLFAHQVECHSGNSAKAHGFSHGRKRVPSMQQSIDYTMADSPHVFKIVNKE
jgi:2,5-diketo-D-gluconate reductase B